MKNPTPPRLQQQQHLHVVQNSLEQLVRSHNQTELGNLMTYILDWIKKS